MVIRTVPSGGVWLQFPSGSQEGPYPSLLAVADGATVVVAELDPPSGLHVVLGNYLWPTVSASSGGP